MTISHAANKFPGWSGCPVRVSPIARPREEKDADEVGEKPLELLFSGPPLLLILFSLFSSLALGMAPFLSWALFHV